MTDPSEHDRLLRELGADLTPVRRLRAPGLRALGWFSVVLAIAAVLAMVADGAATLARLAAVPDLWLSALGSASTAVLAGWAAFELSTPGSRRRWALLPVPPFVLWLGASGLGCLRVWPAPGTGPMAHGESGECLMFIVGLSLPLAILITIMLRRAWPLHPALTAGVAGLACAAAAATLLNFVHPFDAAATDLALHALGVAIVVAATALWGRRPLTR